MTSERACPRCGKTMPADVPAGLSLCPQCLLAAVAARRFEAERGRAPAGWDDLLDGYLPAVPLDPFTAKRPLGYRVSAGEEIEWEPSTRPVYARLPGMRGPPRPPAVAFPPEDEDAGGQVTHGSGLPKG